MTFQTNLITLWNENLSFFKMGKKNRENRLCIGLFFAKKI